MHERTIRRAASLRDHLHVLRRRGWIVAAAAALVPAAAVALSLRQQPRYQSCSQVLLSRQDLATSLTGAQDPNASLQPDRFAQTQADVARVPAVAAGTLARLHVSGVTVAQLLASSSVSAAPNADLLRFCVANADASLARRLADGYAREFTLYRHELDVAPLVRARRGVEARLAQLEQSRRTGTALYTSLVDRRQQLAELSALQTSNAFVVESSSAAVRVQPKPVRNGLLALALGLVLGVALAFLREALDTRVRSTDEVGERLGVPLLARLPEPARRLGSRDGLTMLDDPAGAGAEAFRMLRTNLELALLDRRVKTLMVTSAADREGKSTTVANLAVALARSGKRVVLVDLDLRRPCLQRLFGLESPGLTEVALGHVPLEEALAPILTAPFGSPRRLLGRRPHAHGNGRIAGRLQVLPAGPLPPDPGELVGGPRVREILAALAEASDLVLVDAPPALHVGDALALSAAVDALLVVTRLDVVRRPMLVELGRALSRAPAPAVGFVATAAEAEERYGYGYGYGGGHAGAYASRPEPPPPLRRETTEGGAASAPMEPASGPLTMAPVVDAPERQSASLDRIAESV